MATSRITKAHRILLRRIDAGDASVRPIHGLTWASLCARGLTHGDKRWPQLTPLGKTEAQRRRSV